jgi:hypothetical protein
VLLLVVVRWLWAGSLLKYDYGGVVMAPKKVWTYSTDSTNTKAPKTI